MLRHKITNIKPSFCSSSRLLIYYKKLIKELEMKKACFIMLITLAVL